MAWESIDWRTRPKWQGEIRYFIHPPGASQTIPEPLQTQLGQVANAWRSAGCATPEMVLAGASARRPDVSLEGADGVSVIGWEETSWRYGRGVRAVTQARWTREGVIVEADTLLNGVDYPPFRKPVPLDSALRSTLLHEFGHILGLGHSYDSSALMSQGHTHAAATPGSDDVRGLCALYGPARSATRQLDDVKTAPRTSRLGVPSCHVHSASSQPAPLPAMLFMMLVLVVVQRVRRRLWRRTGALERRWVVGGGQILKLGRVGTVRRE